MRHSKFVVSLVAATAALGQTGTISQRIAARLGANDLQADVSFLASDALEGRGTPSPGLNLAAEYIASQFRRAGLEPVGDDGYFQTGTFYQITPNPDGIELTFGDAPVPRGAITVQDAVAAHFDKIAAYKTTFAELESLTIADVKGKVLILDPAGQGPAAMRRPSVPLAKLEPALIVLMRPAGGPGAGRAPRPQLRESQATTPILVVSDPAVREMVSAAKNGPMDLTVSARIPAPKVDMVRLRNVAGVIRGTDPSLKDTYVIVTAHYDHLGINANAEGDKISNGANDDASGSASVIEISRALAALGDKPRRTIVFVTVFGEEVGGLGARWYTGHPIFPLAKTIADINLEQLGRTDDTEGPKPMQFNLTGFDYTDIAAIFAKNSAETGVKVVKHEKNSDAFFARSDNATFAEAGIPSTTISVSYVFPDYHKVGDEWQKLDYTNMAKVDLAIALGIWDMANNPEIPHWNKENPRAARYAK